MKNKRVLIVEDEILLAEEISIQLDDFGYVVVGIANTAEDALCKANELSPDIVLMDIMLTGETDGIEAAQQIQETHGIPVIYLTAYDSKEILDRARITEPYGYILKPYTPRELNANISMALYKSHSQKMLSKAACSIEVIDCISDAMIGLDRNKNIKFLNSTAESLLGIRKDVVINQCWDKALFCHETRNQPMLKKFIDGTHDSPTDQQMFDADLLTSDQSVLSVEILKCPINKINSILFIVLLIRDVTGRRETERELAKYQESLEELVLERTHELTRINQELDTYNYSVSHDLRAPLRSINGFSKVIQEDYGNILDKQALIYLQRICSASQRMGELIEDLLRLSRISTVEITCEKVDLSELTYSVVDMFKKRHQEQDVNFKIQEGMSAYGDSRLLRIMLENLIDNAMKFSVETQSAFIEIGENIVNSKHQYYVRDNGIGFNMSHSGKMFHVFQRIHSGEKYMGTGVGLAIVQRIINKHLGEVWAKGELGKGASFYFTLDERTCESRNKNLAKEHHE